MKQDPLFFVQDNELMLQSGAPAHFLSVFARTDTQYGSNVPSPAALAERGVNLLRLGVCWESVEHEGPGIYDEAFLAKLRDTVKEAESAGVTVVIEPCIGYVPQYDAAAPVWTFEAAGFNTAQLNAAPADIRKAAASVMLGLFLFGDVTAPQLYVDGCAIQDYLQSHFIDAMRHTARRLKDALCIAGFVLPSDAAAVIPGDMAAAAGVCNSVLSTLLNNATYAVPAAQNAELSIASFMYRFICAYAKKHPHFVMFAPECPAAGGYYHTLMSYEPPLPVCPDAVLNAGA